MSTHQARDALWSTMDSLSRQCRMDPGRAICAATGRINHDDAGEQLVIRTVMPRGWAGAPCPIPAGRDAKGTAQQSNGVVGLLLLDERERQCRVEVVANRKQRSPFLGQPVMLPSQLEEISTVVSGPGFSYLSVSSHRMRGLRSDELVR
jgi:hypothetical protein